MARDSNACGTLGFGGGKHFNSEPGLQGKAALSVLTVELINVDYRQDNRAPNDKLSRAARAPQKSAVEAGLYFPVETDAPSRTALPPLSSPQCC